MTRRSSRRDSGLWMALGLTLLTGACSERGAPLAGQDDPLVVYSGRSEALVAPILQQFSAESGVEIKVRYASTSELVATLLEEGAATPADVFLSQDAAALGALSAGGRLRPLSPTALEKVPERFRAASGDWVGISGRARSVVFEPSRIGPDELPRSLNELEDSRYRGRFGVAPANGSFQAHMAVYRTVNGDEALDELLSGVTDNEPGRYPKNSAIVEAVISGEIDFGLVNHYYLWRARSEDPSVTAENYFMPEGQASSFINLAGAAVLSDRPGAEHLILYLLSEEAQRFFATETFEYPLAEGVAADSALQPLETIRTPTVDYATVAEALPETLATISASGLLD